MLTDLQLQQAAKADCQQAYDARNRNLLFHKPSFIKGYIRGVKSDTAREHHRQEWIPVTERPLVKQEEDIWYTTEDGNKDFLAAVQYEDARKPGEKLWWIRHCFIGDECILYVVGDDDNEVAGWSADDISHWQHFPEGPEQ